MPCWPRRQGGRWAPPAGSRWASGASWPGQCPSSARWMASSCSPDRARHVRPDFSLRAEDADAVRSICRRLDGLPLAIELAAARARALAPARIAAQLRDHFRLLPSGPRTAPARQATLRASFDWSYGLLTEVEQKLLCELSVFGG